MLKPTLYIGLGGTGIRTLLKTKKQFIDTYGEIPPMIQFLGLDTDQGVYERKDKLSSQDVYLTKAEQCSIAVPGSPADYYFSNIRELSWLPKKNVRMIQQLEKGTGIVRTNGRLAFVYNVKNIEASIRWAIDNCREAEPANDWPIDVRIVFSLAGGTGSGIFIDVAYLIRKMFGKSVNLYGYAVLPDIFSVMIPNGPAMMRYSPNAYASLSELDFLMHLDREDEPVTFDWIANSFTEEDFRRTPKPFDLVYLVDNKNARAVKYDMVDNLADVISLALVAVSGEIGATNSRIFDSAIKVLETGDLDVNDKKAWVARLGVSSIVFNYDVLATRICLQCIDDALNEGHGDLKPSLKAIEEIIDKDRVLAVFHNEKEPVLKPSKSKSFVAEADKHCDTAIKLAKESAEKAKDDSVMNASELLSDTESKLLMSSPGCITATLAFLDKAKAQVDSTIDELTKEVADLELNKGLLKHKLEIAQEYYSKEENKFFIVRSRKRMEEYAKDICCATSSYIDNDKDIIRHHFAIQYFNSLSDTLANKGMGFHRLYDLMNNLRDSLTKELKHRQSAFAEIDLAYCPIFNDHLFRFGDYYAATGENNAIEGILTSEDLGNSLFAFIDNNPEFKSWKEKTISEVLDYLPDDVFMEVYRRAADTAEPMLMINPGSGSEKKLVNSFIIGVEDRENSRFVKSLSLQESIKTQHIELVSTGIKNRVLFCREDYAFPAFTVPGVKEWHKVYDNMRVSCHIDTDLHQRMINENYSLYPNPPQSDTVTSSPI